MLLTVGGMLTYYSCDTWACPPAGSVKGHIHESGLLLAAPLSGLVYGSHQAIMPVLASELFDLRRFATLYVLLQQATLLGSYGLANRLVRPPCIPPGKCMWFAGRHSFI